ncbi:MAG: hypothetical protein AAGB06_07220 [Verrucomicrobiota bacterium]
MNLRPFYIALALGLISPFSQSIADETSQQILKELRALRTQVSKLEMRIAELEKAPAPSVTVTQSFDDSNNAEKDKWFNRFRMEMHQSQMRAIGGWTKSENWDKIELKMKPDAVAEILGEPDRIKFSIRKDTDEIYIYEGDLDGQGNIIKGEIRVYKGKVSKIVKPQF